MSLELGKDALYIPRAVKSLGAGVSGANYGVLCVTHENLYYLPKEVVSMERTGALTEQYEVTKLKNKNYAGMPLEDVVPDLARRLHSRADLDRILNEMAEEVEGSCVIPVSEIESYRIGYFAQLTLVAGGEKHRFSIGGKKTRETTRSFVVEQLGLS